ncbi:hypothetical protein [Streptosporangium sp. KLBMP 9127]|nr:hypothetical protein [Streptosporangium sp. KLBMP 9127]
MVALPEKCRDGCNRPYEALRPAAGTLDRQAAAGIERLTCRRAAIAGPRRHGAMPELGPDTPDEEIGPLAEDMVAHYLPLLKNVPDTEVGADAPSMLAAFGEHMLNDQQRRANRLFQERMTNPDER